MCNHFKACETTQVGLGDWHFVSENGFQRVSYFGLSAGVAVGLLVIGAVW